MRTLFNDDSAVVEEIPFRLLLIMTMISLSVYAASSGLNQLQEGRVVTSLEEEMDQFVRVGVATMASGEGTRVSHTLSFPVGGGLSLESLTIGGNFDSPQNGDRPDRYTFTLSNGEEGLRILMSSTVIIQASNADGLGYLVSTSSGEETIHMVAVECQGKMILILVDSTANFTYSDMMDYKIAHRCETN